MPVEIRPFVVAINDLLARVNQSMETQRRFVADAAHELRSPFTALSLQAERLSQADMSDTAHERLLSLRRGIDRGRNLLDQLLTLAKVQTASEQLQHPVSVQQIYRQVLEDLLPLADARRIDIGVEGTEDVQLYCNELNLHTIVKNVVDNAIRYTPEGGKVDLSLSKKNGHVILQIQDSGPGVSLSERERVFDPFYRTLGSNQLGSGLGLSIVKTITDRMGAKIQLAYSDQRKNTGLCVCIVIPTTIETSEKPL